jgi:hypothetical protein
MVEKILATTVPPFALFNSKNSNHKIRINEAGKNNGRINLFGIKALLKISGNNKMKMYSVSYKNLSNSTI